MLIKQTSLKTEWKQFVVFIKSYFGKKLKVALTKFEYYKSLIVALLISKRGKYQSSFLNTSFFLLVASIYIIGPIIAENNPLIGRNFAKQTDANNTVISVYSLNSSNSFNTQISQKPRDAIVNYTVVSGDTLASIAQKFDVSVDTIKWANDLKTDTITTNDKLEIPPISGIVHKVGSGDTVYSIAERYNTSSQNIVNFPFNEFADLDTFALVPGQTLFVPDGTPPSAKPVIPMAKPQFMAGQAGSGTFLWPTTGYISQYPVWYHMALDIANPSSPPVIAADSGTVSYAGCLDWGYGCHVIVDHNNGFQTLYGHLSSIGVSVGQGVGKGGNLGTMGSTGRSTGTHLHFEIRQNGALLDPQGYLQ
jgi:murein DD-endopeptidase MepM/ murein hydrolase activator NlpD